jgi:hypothetical protein
LAAQAMPGKKKKKKLKNRFFMFLFFLFQFSFFKLPPVKKEKKRLVLWPQTCFCASKQVLRDEKLVLADLSVRTSPPGLESIFYIFIILISIFFFIGAEADIDRLSIKKGKILRWRSTS